MMFLTRTGQQWRCVCGLGRQKNLICRWFGQPAAQTHPHLLNEGEVTPGITQEEFRQRRYHLMDTISRTAYGTQHKKHIVIMPASPRLYMTHDIPYTFRQNTDFLYLCGFKEPNSVLILENNGESPLPSHKATLFVPKRDPAKELWEGARSGIEGTIQLTGIENAHNIEDFPKYLKQYAKEHGTFMAWYDFRRPVHLDFHSKYIEDFLKENKLGFVESPRILVQSLRAIKSQAEINLLQKACEIASQSFAQVMKFSHSGVNEAHLYVKMDYECRLKGADYLAYIPVVAGGNRANTIHYISNNQLVNDGDMVLMDAGCEYHGYASDITRTWPVNGEFSKAQLELYEAILEVQEACIKLCSTDVSIELIFHEMLHMIGRQLHRLRIVPRQTQGIELIKAAREFCPHHVGHYLGMDVHDTDEVSRSIRLKPGMVITIEPGLYLPETNQQIPQEFRGIGIRIEDDILITDTGRHNLSAACPKHPKHVLYAMKAQH